MPGAISRPRPLLVLGVLATEQRHGWREKLRQLYAPWADRVVVRYVVDARWANKSRAKPQRRKMQRPSEDQMSVTVGSGQDRHCAHKMVGC